MLAASRLKIMQQIPQSPFPSRKHTFIASICENWLHGPNSTWSKMAGISILLVRSEAAEINELYTCMKNSFYGKWIILKSLKYKLSLANPYNFEKTLRKKWSQSSKSFLEHLLINLNSNNQVMFNLVMHCLGSLKSKHHDKNATKYNKITKLSTITNLFNSIAN